MRGHNSWILTVCLATGCLADGEIVPSEDETDDELGEAFAPSTAAGSQTPCPRDPTGETVIVIDPTDDAVAAMRQFGPGRAYCFTAGRHDLTAELPVESGDRLYGVGDEGDPQTTRLDGNGSAPGPAGLAEILAPVESVTGWKLYDLIVQDARVPVRLTDNTVADGITIRDTTPDPPGQCTSKCRASVEVALKIAGSNVKVTNSKFHHAAAFGVTANQKSRNDADLLFDNNVVAWNNRTNHQPGGHPWAACLSQEGGYTGGSKFIGTRDGADADAWGAVITNSEWYENGGAALWLDIDNKGAFIAGNVAYNNVDLADTDGCGPKEDAGGEGQGIRVEVSCNATVVNNAVHDNESMQIDLAIAPGSIADDNTIEASGTAIGIRVISQPTRDHFQDSPNCSNAAITGHSLANIKVRNNTIKMLGTGYNGVLQNGVGSMSGLQWSGNAYDGRAGTGFCTSATRWRFNGSLTFPGWVARGEVAATETCASTL